jgi:hypothetical protein
MLDPWIIEEIRRREEEQRRREEQRPLVLELPVYNEQPAGGQGTSKPADQGETPPRGIAIIDFSIG